jgi:hypothetical protein
MAAPESAAPRSTGADALQPSAASEIHPDDLRGTWVEYWAVDGGADTERYSFEAGHFDWHAAGQVRGQTAVRKAGAFRIVRDGPAAVLVLDVEHETFEGCAAPCASGGDAREVSHPSPIVERYELGECPSNPEAQRIDTSYTCRAIGGKAFWRKPPPGRADSASATAG